MKQDEELAIIGSNGPVVLAAEGPFGDRTGAPGTFKNPAVAKYDPSGLRSSMSATFPAMDAALELEAKPTHISKPEWYVLIFIESVD